MLSVDQHSCPDKGLQKAVGLQKEVTPSTGTAAKTRLEAEGVDHSESVDTWSDLSKLVMELREMGTRTCIGWFCADNAQLGLLGYVNSDGCKVCCPKKYNVVHDS